MQRLRWCWLWPSRRGRQSTAATGDNAGSSSITIDGAVNEKTYTLYRIFDVASKTDDGMVYNVTTAWKPFFEGNGAGTGYVEIDSLGQVKKLKKEGFANDSENAKAFASSSTCMGENSVKYCSC